MLGATPHLDLTGERYGEAVEVADGFWILATRHHGGGFSRFPEANNRAIVLRLEDTHRGRPGLVVLNATDPAQSFTELQRLQRETGLDLSYVISPGGAHHAFLGAWREAFERAQVLVGAQRVPRTANGQRLLRLSRVAIMDPDDPLPQFAGQLDALSFTGLLGPAPFESPSNEGRDSWWTMLRALRIMMSPSDPCDELWVRHVASQTIIGGENLNPNFTEAAHAELPWLVRRAIEAQTVGIQTDGRKVQDPELVERCWATITAWPATALLSYHDSVGGGFIGEASSALRRAAVSVGQLPP